MSCAGASAQSLTLSYKLDPVPANRSQQAPALVDRCIGLTWSASPGAACGSASFGSALAARASASESARAATRPAELAAVQRDVPESASAPAETFTGFALPALGSASSDGRLLRAARDVPVEAGKTLDLLFRFASKYRLRNTGEGWDVIKFKDVTSENRTQASGVKALAVELLFPFQ